MRILYLSTWFPYPPNSGSKLRTLHLLRGLAQRHDVTLLAFDFDTPASKSKVWPGPEPSCIERIPVNPFAEAQGAALYTRIFSRFTVARLVPAMRDALQKHLRQGAYDVVIASTFMCAPYILQVSTPTIRILEEHNSLTRWIWEFFQQEGRFLQRLYRWFSWQKTRHLEARLFRQFDLVTAVSVQDAAAMLTMLPGYRGPVEVVPNGVDCSHNCPALKERIRNTLVYNGALTYEANCDAMQYFLAQIFPRIQRRVPDLRLTITGSTSGVDLSRLALSNAVSLTGYVEDVRVPVAQAAACVVPLRVGGGTRLKILEAMALGTPVITTSKGADGLDVVDGEHLLLADTPEDFANATVRVLGDSELCATLAHNARRLVEGKYDWQEIGARFTMLVEQAVSRRRGSATVV